MTTLSTGVLRKLVDGMETGAAKPVGEHRTAVLQVTDIVRVDKKDRFFWPGQFYLKVSDSSDSIDVTLPPEQADLVLRNRLQPGQFIHVDRLDPGSPMPFIVGAKPLVVGTPKPGKKAAPWRGSWGSENHAAGVLASPMVVRPTALNFEDRTLIKETPNCAPPPAACSSALVRKSTSVMPRLVSRSRSFAADRGDPLSSKIPSRPFPAEKGSMSCTASRTMSRRAREENPSWPAGSHDDTATSSRKRKRPSSSTVQVPVPAKLNALGKEALEQSEQARKAAQEALHNASATENVSRIYNMFSDLSKTARPDAPAAYFEGFLSFHQEAVQAVAYIESIQAVTSMAATAPVGAAAVVPSALGSSLRMAKQMQAEAGSWFMEFLEAALETGLKKSKSSKSAALERKSSKSASAAGQSGAGGGCEQSLMVRVIKWVEMEQSGGGECGGSRKAGHPRAAAVAKKLKIKAKNPRFVC